MSDRDRTIARRIVWIACGVVLLAAIALATFGSTTCARADRAEADLDSLRLALDLYQERHGDYPEGLDALVADGTFAKTPRDPWGYDYQYVRRGQVVIILSPGLCADHARMLTAPPARTSP